MIDLTNCFEITKPTKIKSIMTCCLILDKKAMLEALMHEKILINGKYYKVPERKLLKCLLHKCYGKIELVLEEID